MAYFEATQHTEAEGVSYVDDDTYLFMASSADALCDIVRQAAAIVLQSYKEFKLPINLGPGKTVVLYELRGRGAVKHRHRISEQQSSFEHVVCGGAVIRIPVQETYRHLGGLLSTAAEPIGEAKARAQSTNTAVKPLLARVLGNPAFDIRHRWDIWNSLAVSRLFYNAATWCYHGTAWCKPIHNVLVSCYSVLCGAWRGNAGSRLPFKELCRILDAPTASQFLSALRLRYWARMLRHAPDLLWALCQATAADPCSWSRLLLSDMVKLKAYSGKLASLPPPATGLVEWARFAVAYPAAWSTLVAQTFCVFRESEHQSHSQDCPRRLSPEVSQGAETRALSPEAGSPTCRSVTARCPAPGEAAAGPDAAQQQQLACIDCGKQFMSQAGLCAHRAAKHGYRNDAQKFARDSSCQRCLLDFRTRPRLAGHLLKSSSCLQAHVSFFAPLSQDEVAEISQGEARDRVALRSQGFCTVKALKPAIQLVGPSIPPFEPPAQGG
jgi:hypothetical protein